MKVLVIGGTGRIGGEVVDQGLERGHDVTALVRDPGTAGVPEGVRTVKGDVLDPESLVAAVDGQEAALSALGASGRGSPPGLLSAGMANLVEAMRARGVRRLVAVSAYGAGDSSGEGGPLFQLVKRLTPMGKMLAEKTRMEEVAAGTDLDWVMVRPPRLTNSPPTGRAQVIFTGGGIGAKCSRADVAAFMLDQLESDEYVRRTPGLVS